MRKWRRKIMFKKIFITSAAALFISQVSLAETVETDALHLAGTYQCYGYDSHEGGYKNATVTLTLDAKNSDFEHNYGAYRFKLTEPDNIEYTGEAAASGNNMAIYFENTNTSESTDRGVGIAVISHDKDTNGKVTTVLHKFYYEPNYQGGGNGSETCVKDNQ